MASDVENLKTFYANLPSIFEADTSNSIRSSSDASLTLVHGEKTYQPMFGSFLFADSEPFMRAAFVPSTTSSMEVKSTEDEQTDEASNTKAKQIPIKDSSPLALAEDISDMEDDNDEDDFDGIPIRHASSVLTEMVNGNNQFVQQIENADDDDGDEEELFLNGFTDEQQPGIDILPSLFNNIPDIDDLNDHDEEDDADHRVPFDHMDMLDQSDSIRSSSPDSVLSSSHLRDDDYNEEDDDDEEEMNYQNDEDDVTQWNDDDLLGKLISRNDRPNVALPSPMILHIPSDDQVNFIDSSRSNSRCSNASSHLSGGYAEQARIFLDDEDGLVTSSDSESDHEFDDIGHLDEKRFTRDNSDEELSLQVNLDYHRSRSSSHSSSSSSDSPHSIVSPILDQSPIVAIDEEIIESKQDIQSAPIANIEEDEEDVVMFTSDQPVLSSIPLKNLFELRHENRQNEIIHDIVNMRHLLDEHDDDDEFLAVMHNPSVFEDVLYDHDDEQESSFFKQTTPTFSAFQTSTQLSMVKRHQSESVEHYQNVQQTSSNEKNCSSNTKTTSHSSPTAVNHLPLETAEVKENVDADDCSITRARKTQQSLEKNTAKINIEEITNDEEEERDHYQMMSSDDESDNDSELLQTLAQLHGLVHTPRLPSEINETEVFQKPNQQQKEEKNNHFILTLKPEEEQNFLSSINDDKEAYRNEEKNSSNFSPLTSLTSSAPFNDDESHSTDLILGSDTSSSLIISNSEYANPLLSSNLLTNKEVTESPTLSSFDLEALPIVEKLVSDIQQSALDEVNQPSQVVEHFVERILSEAIYEVYTEDHRSKVDEYLSNTNLALIIHWHEQRDKRSFDPFDQEFHSVWISHFHTPDDHHIDSSSLYSNAFNETNQAHFIPKEISPSPLFKSPFDSTITDSNSNQDQFATPIRSINTNGNAIFQDDFISYKTDPSIRTDENIDLSATENPDVPEMRSTSLINENTGATINSSNDLFKQRESFFANEQRLSQFESFASDHPLNTLDFDLRAAEISQQLDSSSLVRISIDENVEPWELEENSEENLKPISTSTSRTRDSYNTYLPESILSAPALIHRESTTTDDESEEENVATTEQNYDDYFSKYQNTENGHSVENPASKTVRFSEKLHNVAVITPKDSLNFSQSSTTTSDTDETDDEQVPLNLQTHNDQLDEDDRNNHLGSEVMMRNIVPRPESIISLTESEDLPPPLPPLPPLNNKPTTTNEHIPLKSTLTSPSSSLDFRHKINPRSQSDNAPTIQTTTDLRLHANTDPQLDQLQDSAILRSISKDNSTTDPDEVNDVISCVIDNNQVNIDAKTISPFKCIIGSAGPFDEENSTAVITLYGCYLPDHRLREYRYIMDQLFYYVYHKLEKLVTDDYVLVYFHGATPKHRTPELKFLRKCYQLINFRLRKNLRAVYVVHPTRWLRTVIALSRPFFSNKFYHKVHYIFTIAELKQQFPQNRISIPVIIEQTDWLYSQKYDRHNASMKRFLERPSSRLGSTTEDESAA